MKIAARLRRRIERMDDGTVFSYVDLRIRDTEFVAAAKALSRLVQEGTIRRIKRGTFLKPQRSVFGKVGIPESQLLRLYMYRGNRLAAYVTGTALYNRLGLTTQVPRRIRVASTERVVPSRIGNLDTMFVRSYVEVSEEVVPRLELLDVVKDLRAIPDANPTDIMRFLLNALGEMDERESSSLVRLALSYPPRVRALLGVLLEKVGRDAQRLRKSLNPLSTYVSGISTIMLPEQIEWGLRPQ